MAPKLIQHEFEIGIDDHLFLIVKRKSRATISLDLMNIHGRAGISIRTEGHGIASVLCDVEWSKPKSGNIFARFCPMCGKDLSTERMAAFGHKCKLEE